MVEATVLVARRKDPASVEELVQSVHEVMRSVVHRIHPTLEEEGISKGQFWALHMVSSLGSTSVSAVARHLYVSAPTVCGDIDQLEAAGLVVRNRSRRDRRSVDLTLTPKGRRVESRVWARLSEVVAEAAEDLPPADVAAAVRVFRALSRRLDTHLEESHAEVAR